MTVRVGIVGCGFIAALHSRALKGIVDAGLVDAAVVATCDTDLDRAVAFARAHRAAIATTDSAEVLAAVDAVWICTPTALHRALAEAAASAGVAVFCEKPLAPTLADAEALTEAVVGAGVPHQVGLVLRTAPVFVALRDLLAGGELGRPMAAAFRDDQFFPIQGHYGSSWRADAAIAGGGALIEHSIHDLDLLRFLLGEVADVSGRTANYAGHEGIEDVAVATLAFESGATAGLVSVWHGVLSRPSTRRLEVFCERGMAWTDDDYTGPLHVETSEGAEARACPAPAWVEELPVDRRWRSFAGQYAPANRSFLEALARGRPPEPGLDVALVAHGLADAVYRSAREGGMPVRTRC